MKKPVLVSVCIPVFGTENVLERCLLSVARQDFPNLEVVVVNDASTGRDEKKRDCEKIVKSVLKRNKIPYVYKKHNVNLGIAETRRDTVLYASGKYILSLDSDDFLENPEYLSSLFAAAEREQADIVNSRALVYSNNPKKMEPIIEVQQKKMDCIVTGKIEGSEHQIFDSFLLEKKHLGYLWGKLIRRDLFLKAFDLIPCTFCTMGEDLLIYFFVSLNAKIYFGVEETGYRYTVDEGISSEQLISDLDRWHKVCSASSVFTVLSEYIKEHYDDFTVSERNEVRFISNGFVLNNLKQLNMRVAPEIKDEAYDLLCEMWGPDYVKAIEALPSD